MTNDRLPTTGAENRNDDPLAGDPELRKELASMFIEDSPKLVLQIQAVLMNRDGQALKMAARTMKGSVGVFMNNAAFEAVLRMEHVGQDAKSEQAEGARGAVQREVARLSAMLIEDVASPLVISQRDNDAAISLTEIAGKIAADKLVTMNV